MLQRQIQHHEGIPTMEPPDLAAAVESTQSPFVGSATDSNALPDLNLDVDMDTSNYRLVIFRHCVVFSLLCW